MNTNHRRGKAYCLLLGSLALASLSGCAQMPTQGGSAGASDTQCNPALAGAVGALAGAFAGKGKGHLVGAALGAGIGALACTAYNYHVRKLRDEQQLNAAYRQQHGALPQANTVTSYASNLQPGSTVRAGSHVTVQSTIGVVGGTHDVPPQVSEKLTLVSPEGKALSSATKDAAAITSGGEYQTGFDFDLPKGIKNGRYTVRTEVLMNGQTVRTSEAPMLVVG